LEEDFRELEESRNEGKLANALYRQLSTLKKREKNLHSEIQLVLRSPTEVGQNFDVVYLKQQGQTVGKDIELGELRRMLGLILKLHAECTG
jgi:hypothetical protein